MNTELARVIPENFISLAQGAGQILATNKTYVAIYQEEANRLLGLASAKSQNGKLPDDLDADMNNFLVSLKKATKAANEARSPLTQTFTAISKEFTGVENQLSVIYQDIQTPRDINARVRAEERARIEAEEQRKFLAEKERINVASEVERQISLALAEMIRKDKQMFSDTFDNTDLEQFESVREFFNTIEPFIHIDRYNAIYPQIQVQFLNREEYNNIIINVRSAAKFDEISKLYREDMAGFIASLNAKFDAKHAELIAIQQAGAEEAARIKKEADERKDMERQRIEAEAEQARQVAEEQANLNREMKIADAQIATEMTIIESSGDQGGQTIEGYTIDVLNPFGYQELFSFYFLNEGKTETLDKLAKKSLGQMKTFAEKLAMKNNFIESKNLKYNKKYKAVAKSIGRKAA